jgi:hypothetical protein
MVWATNFFDFAFGFGAFVTPMVLALIHSRRYMTDSPSGTAATQACNPQT